MHISYREAVIPKNYLRAQALFDNAHLNIYKKKNTKVKMGI